MTIELKGHLDTNKVAEVKAEIDRQLANLDNAEHLVIDCHNLEYISSSGLRIIIGIKKSHPNMEVTGVSAGVYNVFEMTGFTRILDISRALRRIDPDQCQLIGEGGNGAVYRINDEEIVKVSKYAKNDEALIRESEQVREAFIMGVPTVISFDTVEMTNGQKGIVMEALDSQSLGAYITEHPESLDDIVPKYVNLFRQSNAISTDSPLFHNTKEWLRWHLTLPQRIINDEEAALMETILDAIPDDNKFIHFDGHVGNVLMQGAQDNRSLMLIDMGDAGTGHPVLEIAGWAFMMLEPDYAEGNTMSERITGMTRQLQRDFCRRVLAEMFHVTDAAELDHLMHEAALVGRVKAAFMAQRFATIVPDEKFRRFIVQNVRETLTLVPEIKAAIHFFVEKMQGLGTFSG